MRSRSERDERSGGAARRLLCTLLALVRSHGSARDASKLQDLRWLQLQHVCAERFCTRSCSRRSPRRRRCTRLA
jgi:hypothetical protein